MGFWKSLLKFELVGLQQEHQSETIIVWLHKITGNRTELQCMQYR